MNISELNPLWVSVFVTVILVIITGLYLWETRKIRLESARPIFSLRPGVTDERYLINTGRLAKDVNVDVKSSANEDKSFFVSSFDSGQEIDLETDFEQIKKDKGFVKVELKFNDGYNRERKDSISVDFKQLSKEEREIAFSFSPKEDHIEKIAWSLERIERKSHK
ncbi:MAG: hypothetical protein JW878_01505 [Methanomicrobia archaeon]|nr:hypothetical protein [Methanomicrobia archaeon]